MLHEYPVDVVESTLQVVEPVAERHECIGDPADVTLQRLSAATR